MIAGTLQLVLQLLRSGRREQLVETQTRQVDEPQQGVVRALQRVVGLPLLKRVYVVVAGHLVVLVEVHELREVGLENSVPDVDAELLLPKLGEACPKRLRLLTLAKRLALLQGLSLLDFIGQLVGLCLRRSDGLLLTLRFIGEVLRHVGQARHLRRRALRSLGESEALHEVLDDRGLVHGNADVEPALALFVLGVALRDHGLRPRQSTGAVLLVDCSQLRRFEDERRLDDGRGLPFALLNLLLVILHLGPGVVVSDVELTFPVDDGVQAVERPQNRGLAGFVLPD